MLVALFALLLLSVVGLGMMYSTNMETAINSNYRDKQKAMYAAMAGLQEARDRLRPYDLTQAVPTGRIVAPSALPSLSAGDVIYIINPQSGQTIALSSTRCAASDIAAGFDSQGSGGRKSAMLGRWSITTTTRGASSA